MSPLSRDQPQDLPAPPAPGVDGGWALFLDVDGTLLDIAERPNDVTVDPQLVADLAILRARLDGAVALLSGRPLPQLDDLLHWRGHAAAGLHGAELRMPDGRERVRGDPAAFETVRTRAIELIAGTGILLEDKRRALALHYRRAPGARDAAERVAALLQQATGERYTLQRGNHVVELKPAGADKGRSLEALMQVAPFRGRQPWVLGDDLTDEDAFRYVNDVDGVSVIVGARRPTGARRALIDPAAVRAWLHRLAGPSPEPLGGNGASH